MYRWIGRKHGDSHCWPTLWQYWVGGHFLHLAMVETLQTVSCFNIAISYIYNIYIYITWCKGYRGSLKTYSSIHVFFASNWATSQPHWPQQKSEVPFTAKFSTGHRWEKNDPSYSKSFHVFSSKFHQSSKLLDLLNIHKVSAFASSSHEEATWLCAGTKRSIQSSNQCQCQELAFQFWLV